MINKVARALFGSANDRFVKKQQKIINKINLLEDDIVKLSDEELKAKTFEFRKRIEEGSTLDDLLPEAFAVVREAAKRTLGQRHYDVQLVGGLVLHNGMISEMKTVDCKTLVSTLAAYLNGLSGKGVHVVTVNDYLAKRDAEWMGQVYRFLGLSVDCIVHGKSDEERRIAYAADITYATNNELGFDYLRDNMKFSLEEMVQRPFNYAIVDEVDSILIDEARTPLIISGAAEDSSEKYISVNSIIPRLREEDYEKDEKARTVILTETGMEHVEQLLKEVGIIKSGGLYDMANVSLVHHVGNALKAHKMQIRDVDYIVKDGKVVIIDEFTGRMMEGRRYSDGLHQAIEAKENVNIQSENQTLASITFQNYFRLYPKISGMTGTAMTEEAEFVDIYGLSCIEIPTNKPVQRIDHHDEIYRTAAEKYDAIIATILDCHKKGQPILVGTTSIEKSELVAELLRAKSNVKFEILNARHHEREASIIAQAGVSGAITIATNMAGRGTDIQLGGNVDMQLKSMLKGDETEAQIAELRAKIKADIELDKQKVVEAGGLYILCTERHESRRIDNQLRGRAGRQGDSGASKFFLSMEDDLMRIFGSDKMTGVLYRLGVPEGEPLVHPWISKALEKAQQKVEERNFDIRKSLLKYDNVMNDQRKVIYEQRKELMNAADVSDTLQDMREEYLSDVIFYSLHGKSLSKDWASSEIEQELLRITGFSIPIASLAKEADMDIETFIGRVLAKVEEELKAKNAHLPEEIIRMVGKNILIQTVDQLWKEHIATLDYMRHTIGLRAYGQKDPLNEYKKEAFSMFSDMLDAIRERVTFLTCRAEIRSGDSESLKLQEEKTKMTAIHEEPKNIIGENKSPEVKTTPFAYAKTQVVAEDESTWGKVARNDVCPCGSGKKYKHCHGKIAS